MKSNIVNNKPENKRKLTLGLVWKDMKPINKVNVDTYVNKFDCKQIRFMWK